MSKCSVSNVIIASNITVSLLKNGEENTSGFLPTSDLAVPDPAGTHKTIMSGQHSD